MKENIRWFTLVELIVVITILAILGTIAFISFQGHAINSRDSVRLADAGKINRLAEYRKAQQWYYPLPDNAVEIYASGSLIWYQWTAGPWFLRSIKSNEVLDPVSEKAYTTYVLKGRTALQIMAFLEKGNIASIPGLSPTYATNSYEIKKVKTFWKQLWILTDPSNIPIQEIEGITSIDLVTTNNSFISHISDTQSISGSWSELRYTVPRSSCKRLLEMNEWWISGYYDIYPIGEDPIKVYCNMEYNGGGLTMIARSVDDTDFNGTPFGWFVSRWDIKDDSQPYSLGSIIQDIPFEEVYLAVYDTGKNITWYTKLAVNDIEIFSWNYATSPLAVEGCEWEPITISGIGTINSCLAFNLWWKFESTESYWFSFDPTDTNDGLNRRRYGASYPYPGIIFVK